MADRNADEKKEEVFSQSGAERHDLCLFPCFSLYFFLCCFAVARLLFVRSMTQAICLVMSFVMQETTMCTCRIEEETAHDKGTQKKKGQ